MPTPYDLVTSVTHPQPGTKADLLRITRGLETEALQTRPTRIRAALQDVRHVTAATRLVYADFAARRIDVALLAQGLPAHVATGVRGVDLAEDDPLIDQWCLVVAGGARPVVLAATDLHEPVGSELDRSFTYAVSRDPSVVAACLAVLGDPALGDGTLGDPALTDGAR